MPCVQGVATGAILSDDQRIRVESVCSRLQLRTCGSATSRTCSKRWGTLKSEVEAILIEVAAMGLEPKKHLAKTLGMMHKPTSSCCRTCTGCTAAARAANSSPPPHPQRWGSTATSHFVLSCNCFHVQLLYHDTSIPRFCTRIPVLQMYYGTVFFVLSLQLYRYYDTSITVQ